MSARRVAWKEIVPKRGASEFRSALGAVVRRRGSGAVERGWWFDSNDGRAFGPFPSATAAQAWAEHLAVRKAAG